MNLHSIVGSRNRVKVLRALMRRDGQSGRQVAGNAGIAPSASKTSLEELVECGLVLQVQERGRLIHHLNRSHYLMGPLQRLFTEEGRLPQQLADDVMRHLRTLDPPAELLCVGISETGTVSLATTPRVTLDITPVTVLGKQIRFKYGLQLTACVGKPSQIPAADRVWVLSEAEPQPPGVSAQARRRALRFFGIADPEERTGTAVK